MASLVTEELKHRSGGWSEVRVWVLGQIEERASDLDVAMAESQRAAGGQGWPDLLPKGLENIRLPGDHHKFGIFSCQMKTWNSQLEVWRGACCAPPMTRGKETT